MRRLSLLESDRWRAGTLFKGFSSLLSFSPGRLDPLWMCFHRKTFLGEKDPGLIKQTSATLYSRNGSGVIYMYTNALGFFDVKAVNYLFETLTFDKS